jgi:hypothetical protein
MKAVVIFESMYGNTHSVAEEVASGLKGVGEVVVGSTDEVPLSAVAAADLVVVGGPTHVHGMTSKRSRDAAAEAAAGDVNLDLDEAANAPGLRDWLKGLPEGNGRLSAAYDTRIDKPILVTGSAAKGIAKRLRHLGFRACGEPASFLVADSGGPLLPGQLERARRWGEELAARVNEGASVSE